MFWRKKKNEPSPSAANPAIEPSPTTAEFSDDFKKEMVKELEAAGTDEISDVVTAGIGMIKMGAEELFPGWLRAFAKADVFVLSVEEKNPSVAFCFGPNASPDFIAVFTRLDLAQEGMQQSPKLRSKIRMTGLSVLEMASQAKKGIWINVMSDACSVSFPASVVAALIKEVRHQ
jgi:hypothetical protein